MSRSGAGAASVATDHLSWVVFSTQCPGFEPEGQYKRVSGTAGCAEVHWRGVVQTAGRNDLLHVGVGLRLHRTGASIAVMPFSVVTPTTTWTVLSMQCTGLAQETH